MVALWPVERASHARDQGSNPQFKKSQTEVLTTERYFTLSEVCRIVDVLEDSVRVTQKKLSDSCRPTWTEMH